MSKQAHKVALTLTIHLSPAR